MDIAVAAKNRQTELIRYMIQHSPERTRLTLETTDLEYKGTALYWMCVNGELDIVSRLLEHGADVNTSNTYRHTPLHAASDMGFLNIVKLLLKYGAKTNTQNLNGQTPLHLAAYRGYYEIAESLLLAGADLSITNYRSHTPFQESLAMNHMHISPLFSTNNNNSDSLLKPEVYTRVSLTRTRSHSPKTTRQDEPSSSTSSLNSNINNSLPSPAHRRSLFNKRHRSHEYITVQPVPPTRIPQPRLSVNSSYPSQRQQQPPYNSVLQNQTYTTLPSSLRVCQPTDQAEPHIDLIPIPYLDEFK